MNIGVRTNAIIDIGQLLGGRDLIRIAGTAVAASKFSVRFGHVALSTDQTRKKHGQEKQTNFVYFSF